MWIPQNSFLPVHALLHARRQLLQDMLTMLFLPLLLHNVCISGHGTLLVGGIAVTKIDRQADSSYARVCEISAAAECLCESKPRISAYLAF